jgi:hypothetical protein
MNKDEINNLVRIGSLRPRQVNPEKIKSIISSLEINVKVLKKMDLDEDSATIIFTGFYESIRQLGEVKWWMEGYEPQGIGSHGLSLDILKELKIKESVKLNYLERFKTIRHDANYRGFRVSVAQAKEIIDFWDKCGKKILGILKDSVKK